MTLTYDPKYGVAYICFREKPEKVTTLTVSEELNIDIAEDGRVYGIELLRANEQLTADKRGALVVVNEDSGASQEIKLAV